MDPMFVRTPAVPLATIPGSLPVSSVPDDVDPEKAAAQGLQSLQAGLQASNLTDEAIWRDQWALTGTSRTFFGPRRVFSAWSELTVRHRPHRFKLLPTTSRIVSPRPECGWVQAEFVFETEGGADRGPGYQCAGLIGVVLDKDRQRWQIWLLSTVLEAINGFPNPDVLDPRAQILDNGISSNPHTHSYDCVIVGAGMAGLSTAGRLKAVGVSAITLESNAQIGDNWTNRYDSAKLHTGRDYGHLPFTQSFTPDDDYYLTARQLSRGFSRFVEEYGINVWLSSTLESGAYNEHERMWTLKVKRRDTVEPVTISTRHVVLCLGSGGQVPKMPALPNRDRFAGIVMHSVDYKSPKQWRDKTGVVIGTGNTGHDVAVDMVEAGLKSVTMVQRNATIVIPAENFNMVNDRLYNVQIPTAIADRRNYAYPIAIQRQMAMIGGRKGLKADPARYAALERVGFKLDRDPDMMTVINERLGGHYMDVGAGKMITSGQIKIKSDAAIRGFTATGLEFDDGSSLDADVIIFCTGFEGNMRQAAARIFGADIEKGLDDFWGVDAEGELRGAWKKQGYPGIWYHGGTIGQGRYYSRFLALQIKADIEGVPLPLYRST